ncbi:MAG: KOW motif-containing protein [Dehalococcoidia bacterium]
MMDLFGKGLSAYPSNWTARRNEQEEITLGGYVEVRAGPYSELQGVVTYVEREYAWVRFDGDAYDLRFRLDLLKQAN